MITEAQAIEMNDSYYLTQRNQATEQQFTPFEVFLYHRFRGRIPAKDSDEYLMAHYDYCGMQELL